jgi:hypothetical protein
MITLKRASLYRNGLPVQKLLKSYSKCTRPAISKASVFGSPAYLVRENQRLLKC